MLFDRHPSNSWTGSHRHPIAITVTRAGILLLLSISVRAQVDTPPVQAYRDYALAHDGAADRGRALFADTNRLLCSTCHSVDGSDSRPGPDLMGSAAMTKEALARAILEPSREIAIGFENLTVTTTDETVYNGFLKDESVESITLVAMNGAVHELSKALIASRSVSPISLMPPGLHASLTPEEFTDLIAYLQSLKTPAASESAPSGQPTSIPVLATPVPLIPFLPEALRFSYAFVVEPGDLRYGLTWFEQVPETSDTFMAAQQTGELWLVEKGPSGTTKTLFANFNEELFNQRGPNGLQSVAFHPEFQTNRKYYLKHQVLDGDTILTTVVEKVASADLRHDSGQPSRRLIAIPCVTQNHTGGCLRFGPDGFLYLGMGDTGPQRDPRGHGQDMSTLLGKMIRIDVDGKSGALPYAIPEDNPFIDDPNARPEIWASGFREPWRFSFDSVTGDLWIGDVGQDQFEEVAIVGRGENHGWNVMEGFAAFSQEYRKEGTQYFPPVFAYPRAYGNSVTGGYVFRGDKGSPFYGMYICGDYTSHRIWAVQQEERTLKQVIQIATAPQGIASFSEDAAGNLYVVGYEGMVYRLALEAANPEINF